MTDEQKTPSVDDVEVGVPADAGAPTPVVDPVSDEAAPEATHQDGPESGTSQGDEQAGDHVDEQVAQQVDDPQETPAKESGATAAQSAAPRTQPKLGTQDAEPDAAVTAGGTDGPEAPAADTEPAAATEPTRTADPAPEPITLKTTGSFEPYTLGDPGRAFTHGISLVESKYRDAHDIVIDSATVPDPDGTERLALRAVSYRGLSHAQYGDPRQDDHCVVVSHDGQWLVCLVADGVSSGEWSHLAAKVATEEGASHVVKLLETHQPHEVPFRQVFDALADLLGDVCAQLPDSEPAVDLTRQEVARRMATTLVVAIVATRPDEDGTHPVTVVRLGDSSAWVLDDDEGWINLGEVKNAGNVIAGSATASLPLVPDEDVVPVRTTLGAGAALILMTDGIGDPLGSGKGEVGRHLASLWRRPPHALEFAAQAGFGRKTYDDDRGIIGVWLVDEE